MKPGKQLYQWDVNQFLIELQPTAEFVDYPMGNEVIRIKSDGTRCRIPDEVLQTYGGKTCYERYPDGTYRAYSFTVLYAPKPPDYVYTPEERTTFEALTARVDSAIEEIKRRADSGEFTPVKGVDYFTDAEKNEMMDSVSDGAIGEFRKVVDTATTEYNENHNLKLAKYNANAAEKLTTYDTNAEQHTTDYNRNAAEKLEAYNQNHTAKVAEYNQNAETKTAEFDANAAALQTEVDRLRGECDKLAAENRKQENRISALLKLNKGQTYDILPEEGETASRTAPSGAKYVSVDKVGGKSIVWNQLVQNGDFATDGYWSSYNDDYATYTRENKTGKIVVNSVPTKAYIVMMRNYDNNSMSHSPKAVVGHKYLFSADVKVSESISMQAYNSNNGLPADKLCSANEWTTIIGINKAAREMMYMCVQPSYLDDIKVGLTFYAKNAFNIDLTQMFGAGNEPSTLDDPRIKWIEDYANEYPEYNIGELISYNGSGIKTIGFNLFDADTVFTDIGLVKQSDGSWYGKSSGFFLNKPVWKNEIGYSGRICVTYKYKFGAPSKAGIRFLFTYMDGTQADLYVEPTTSFAEASFTSASNKVVKTLELTYGSGDIDSYLLDVCINLSWSGYRNGEYEPYWSRMLNLPILTYFSDGMKSAGSVRDELTKDKAVKRIGVVDLGTLDWTYDTNISVFYTMGIKNLVAIPAVKTTPYICNKYVAYPSSSRTTLSNSAPDKTFMITSNGEQKDIAIKDSAYTDVTTFKAAMNGVMLYYELAEPIETTITPPLDLTYKVADFGTEESITEGKSTPFIGIIKYSDDFTRGLVNMPKNYDTTASLDALAASLSAMLTSALDGTVTITRGAYDPATKKYEWSCQFTKNQVN